MLDCRPHVLLEVFQLFTPLVKFALRQLLAIVQTRRHTPSDFRVAVFFPSFDTLIVGGADRHALAALPQRMLLCDIGDVACRTNECVNQSRRCINADV